MDFQLLDNSQRAQSLGLSGRKRQWLTEARDPSSSNESKRLRHQNDDATSVALRNLSDDATSALPPLDYQPSLEQLELLTFLETRSPSAQLEESCTVRSAEEMNSQFEPTGRTLGSGQFGKVVEMRDRWTGEKVACKSIRKPNHGGMVTERLCSHVEEVKKEAAMMAKLEGHEGVVQMRGIYESQEDIHLVLELCEGDLFDEIIRRQRFSETEAAHVFSQLVKAVAACHQHQIFHRDLKPENCLITRNSDGIVNVKLADFGLAMELYEEEKLFGVAGSPFYMAPEVLTSEYDKMADNWSLGVILYILLSGSPPFWGETDEEVFVAIKKGDIDFTCEPWATVSPQAKELIKALLSKNPQDRTQLEEVLLHPWMQGQDSFGSCSASVAASSLMAIMMTRAFGSIVA